MKSERTAPGPLGWRNPLVVSSRDIRAQHFAASSEASGLVSGSTTTTSTYVIVGSGQFNTTTKKITIWIPMNITVKHSVSRAKIFIGTFIYTPDGLTLLGNTIQANITLPITADDWMGIQLVGIINAEVTNILPGRHNMYVLISNQTAGTLSWGEPSSTDSFGYFTTGTVDSGL